MISGVAVPPLSSSVEAGVWGLCPGRETAMKILRWSGASFPLERAIEKNIYTLSEKSLSSAGPSPMNGLWSASLILP
jgi:hypothetical protein